MKDKRAVVWGLMLVFACVLMVNRFLWAMPDAVVRIVGLGLMVLLVWLSYLTFSRKNRGGTHE